MEKQIRLSLPRYIVARFKQITMSFINSDYIGTGLHNFSVKKGEDLELEPLNPAKDIEVPKTCRYRVRPSLTKLSLGNTIMKVVRRSRRGSNISDSPRGKSFVG